MAGRRSIRTVEPTNSNDFRREPKMTYAVFNQSAGGTIDIFHQVVELLPAGIPEGLLMQVAGEGEGGVAVLSVWRSKEDADRFFADHHAPALAKVLGAPPPRPDTMVEFEATDVLVTESASSA
jgi:hypothetical protein